MRCPLNRGKSIGVLPETIEAWRQEAVEALATVFRNGGKTPRERELERENKELREALARQSIKVALYEKKSRGCRFSAAEVRAMNLKEAIPGATVTLICEVFELSRQAYYAAGKPKADSGDKPSRKSKENGHPWVPVEELKTRIRAVKEQHPAWGVHKVWASLRHVEGVTLGKRRVWCLMREMGLLFAPAVHRAEQPNGHVTCPEPNRRWASDLTAAYTQRDGWVWIVPVVDCGCRSVLEIEVGTAADTATVLRLLERALEEAFGEPSRVPDGLEIRTDHGSQFTSRLFEQVVAEWGLTHTLAPVGRPTGNAVVERVIRTMKEECIWLRDWESADELGEALRAWRMAYNERRPHQALGWRTPAAYRTERLSTRRPYTMAA